MFNIEPTIFAWKHSLRTWWSLAPQPLQAFLMDLSKLLYLVQHWLIAPTYSWTLTVLAEADLCGGNTASIVLHSLSDVLRWVKNLPRKELWKCIRIDTHSRVELPSEVGHRARPCCIGDRQCSNLSRCTINNRFKFYQQHFVQILRSLPPVIQQWDSSSFILQITIYSAGSNKNEWRSISPNVFQWYAPVDCFTMLRPLRKGLERWSFHQVVPQCISWNGSAYIRDPKCQVL